MGGKINTANRAAKNQRKDCSRAGKPKPQRWFPELVERYYGLALARRVVEVRQQVVDGVSQHLKDAIALEQNGMIPHSERLYVEFKMAEAERGFKTPVAGRNHRQCTEYARTTGRGSAVTTMFVLGNLEDSSLLQRPGGQVQSAAQPGSPSSASWPKEGVRLQRANFLPQVTAMGGARRSTTTR